MWSKTKDSPRPVNRAAKGPATQEQTGDGPDPVWPDPKPEAGGPQSLHPLQVL
jgi:hypothetical protein